MVSIIVPMIFVTTMDNKEVINDALLYDSSKYGWWRNFRSLKRCVSVVTWLKYLPL